MFYLEKEKNFNIFFFIYFLKPINKYTTQYIEVGAVSIDEIKFYFIIEFVKPGINKIIYN